MRLLIAIVAKNDEHTLKPTLDRIPLEAVREHDIELFVVDDASEDGTFNAGLDWAKDWSDGKVTVLGNPRPQGYGGNLKLAFEYAIDREFDAVALLHADGKYAPESLPALLVPIRRGEADVVLGSRFMDPDRGVGGMSFARSVANRGLTWLGNRLLGTRFNDLHSGYRAYSVPALRGIPYHYATDHVHFDLEVLVQLVKSGARFVEVAIPGYSAEREWSYPRGLDYVRNAIATTVATILHDMGVRYKRKYDIEGGPAEYSLKLGYRSSHTEAIESVPAGSRVLDIGCGKGYVGRELLDRGCTVTGLDQYTPEPGNVSEFFTWSLDQNELPVRLADFDVVLLLDIVEHLASPERFMEQLRRSSELSQPLILISVPNIAFLPVRLMLLIGQFNYGKEGILDFTHTRLFTLSALKSMLDQVGYQILEVRGIPAPYPKAIGTNPLSRALVFLNDLAIRLSKRLFSYQFFLSVRPLPMVGHLLEATLRYSAKRRDADS